MPRSKAILGVQGGRKGGQKNKGPAPFGVEPFRSRLQCFRRSFTTFPLCPSQLLALRTLKHALTVLCTLDSATRSNPSACALCVLALLRQWVTPNFDG